MKKALYGMFAGLLMVGSAMAQEVVVSPSYEKTGAPVPFAFNGSSSTDIVGLRLNLWGDCDTLTGLDLGFHGKTTNMYGLQLNILLSEARDRAGAFQVAIINRAGELTGAQLGLWNRNTVTTGVQLGLVNISDSTTGLQVGLLNTTEVMKGYQIGLINVIRSSTVPFFPIINLYY